MLLRLQNVKKAFSDVTVFSGISLEVGERDRIGLLGINGAGKTTLLNLMAGALAPDEGEAVRAKNLTVGYLRQNDALDSSRTLEEEARDAFAPLCALRDEMDAAARRLAAAPGDDALLGEYGRLQALFAARDGYHMDEEICKVFTGLGFAGFARGTRVSTLSGGEKMRFGFAKLLLQKPGLLLLDEPTNHLDFSMLEWLEGYLASYKGAVVAVSHDRYFLDAVAADVCELSRGSLVRYRGGYTGFVRQKEERGRAQLRAYEKQQDEIARMEDYVRRNLARASTTGMAKSRRKALERMERLPRPAERDKGIALRFEYDVEPFRKVLECEGLSVSVGEGSAAKSLFAGLDLTVLRGEKIALVGPNGVGKSSFLKAVQNLLPHGGAVRVGGNVRIGYFDQELAGLPQDAGVMEAVHRCYPAKTEFEVRLALGRLLIEGEDAHKRVRELSGAQRAKAAFAILQMRRANLLILDEPTNHLDYGAKEALEQALCGFGGTLLAVSHDRYFLRRVPDAILELTENGFVRYDGSYDDYLRQKAQRAAAAPPRPAAAPPPRAESPAQGGYRTKQRRAQDAQRRQNVAALEKRIADLEAGIKADGESLANPANAADFELLARCAERLREQNALLAEAMEEWVAEGI